MTIPDPVTVQIIRSRVSSLMAEMDYRFYRSDCSTIVRESRDFSCVVTDREPAKRSAAANARDLAEGYVRPSAKVL